jgi:hypothetical protein
MIVVLLGSIWIRISRGGKGVRHAVRWKASSGWKKIDGVMDCCCCIELRTTQEEEEAINCGHPIGEPL